MATTENETGRVSTVEEVDHGQRQGAAGSRAGAVRRGTDLEGTPADRSPRGGDSPSPTSAAPTGAGLRASRPVSGVDGSDELPVRLRSEEIRLAKPLDVVEFVAANLYGRRCYTVDGYLVWDRACYVEPGDELSHSEYLRLHAKGYEEVSL